MRGLPYTTEGISVTTKDQRSCFVIGPIGSVGSETRKAADFLLNGIIRHAIGSYHNLKIWRADEDTLPGMITDKLINDLHDADIVVADLSELNPNAFYELGIRHATEKPTIHMATVGTKLPFDNLGHRTIFFDKSDWTSIEEARNALLEQCEEAISDSFRATNPVSQALSVKAFRASARSSDNMIGELMQRMESIETAVSARSVSEKGASYSSRDLATRERERKLSATLGNISSANEYKKMGITQMQISEYSRKNCDSDNYSHIMDQLKLGKVHEILIEVSSEIPF